MKSLKKIQEDRFMVIFAIRYDKINSKIKFKYLTLFIFKFLYSNIWIGYKYCKYLEQIKIFYKI